MITCTLDPRFPGMHLATVAGVRSTAGNHAHRECPLEACYVALHRANWDADFRRDRAQARRAAERKQRRRSASSPAHSGGGGRGVGASTTERAPSEIST